MLLFSPISIWDISKLNEVEHLIFFSPISLTHGAFGNYLERKGNIPLKQMAADFFLPTNGLKNKIARRRQASTISTSLSQTQF